MSEVESLDFFRDGQLVNDPYLYLAALCSKCPVHRESHHDVVMVTGYDEALTVLGDSATFSSCMSVTGPFPGLPVPLEGDDVSELIEAHPDGAQRGREPRSETVRRTRHPRPVASKRPASHRFWARCALVPRCSTGSCRGTGLRRAPSRPHHRNRDRRGQAWPRIVITSTFQRSSCAARRNCTSNSRPRLRRR